MKQGVIQRPNNRLVESELKSRGTDLTETKSHTLAHIIKSARMIIVAPLVAGAYQVPTLISTNQYLAAVKCAAVAGVAFLILAGSLGLADLAVELVERRRERRS